MASTKTSGNLVVPTKYGFLCDEPAIDLYVLDYIHFTRWTGWKIIRVAKGCNFLGNYMEVFRAALIHFKR